jgi:hypothetical protein
MLFYWGKTARNRRRILAIQDDAPSALETLARMFTDPYITDDGSIPGRLRAILNATQHRFVPGLHTGADLGLSGFRAEFEDPWETSRDQAGHFLTAARLAFDPAFLSNPIFPVLLGATGDNDIPLRLIIGHEKEPDPPQVTKINLKTLAAILRCYRVQYRSTAEEDIDHFRAGDLDAIQVGTGQGNSMADLRLSYKGWIFGGWIAEDRFRSKEEIASWIRTELGVADITGTGDE